MRPGYYVEGTWYGTKRAQAQARARHLTAQYGRQVLVTLRGFLPVTGATDPQQHPPHQRAE